MLLVGLTKLTRLFTAILITCNPHPVQVDQYGRSALATQLLGSWAQAPKSAKAEFSHFLQLMSRILGGEASAQEVEVRTLRSALPHVHRSM